MTAPTGICFVVLDENNRIIMIITMIIGVYLNYGLYSDGLDSYGLYSAGLYSYGLYGDGLDSYGMYSYGLCSYGLYGYGYRVMANGRKPKIGCTLKRVASSAALSFRPQTFSLVPSPSQSTQAQ